MAGWNYCKSHEINGATGAGTNYQIRVKVHYGGGIDSGEDVYCNGHCRADFGDVRFTDDDGSTMLDYWMQEKVDSDYAVFWIEVKDDLSSFNQRIYIYYGRSDATTTSDGGNTFLFFDDFNNLDNWVVHSGTWSIEDGTVKCTAGLILKRSFANSDGAILYRARISNVGNYWRAIVYYRTNSDLNQGYRSGWGHHPELGGKMIFIDRYYYGWEAISYTTKDWSTNTWYISEARFYGSSHKFEFNHDGSPISVTDSTQLSNDYIAIHASTSDYPIWFDWYAFRKYVDPEPTHGSWGREEMLHPELTPPFWMQWWFWTIWVIMAGIFFAAVYFLGKGKPLKSTVPRIRSEGLTDIRLNVLNLGR
ncbi:MAG: DUF2341 domain-containing protein [archaeon]|nr:DUF2341 domain-containing protein [archaeon]